MQAIISKAALLSLIGKLQSIVSPKPPLPILANVLIEGYRDQLTISATDLTVSMRTHAEAKVVEEGSITLPARRFFQLIRELTAPQIELHAATPEIAHINASSSHFKLNGMHKSEFPTLPDLTGATSFTLPSHIFKEMLARSSFAAAREDSRHTINGVLMKVSKDTATFVGTDGKRLAMISSPIEMDKIDEGSYIIPLKAVEEIVKMLDASEDKVKCTLAQDKVELSTGGTTLITKLLAGGYPDVSRVIPKKSSVSVTLHREELISLLRQVSLFTSESSSSVRFTFLSGELQLSANSSEIGEGKVSMPLQYEGQRLDIAFNPVYFLDILKHSKDETLDFDITDSYNPVAARDSTTALFVIMPMRLHEN